MCDGGMQRAAAGERQSLVGDLSEGWLAELDDAVGDGDELLGADPGVHPSSTGIADHGGEQFEIHPMPEHRRLAEQETRPGRYGIDPGGHDPFDGLR